LRTPTRGGCTATLARRATRRSTPACHDRPPAVEMMEVREEPPSHRRRRGTTKRRKKKNGEASTTRACLHAAPAVSLTQGRTQGHATQQPRVRAARKRCVVAVPAQQGTRAGRTDECTLARSRYKSGRISHHVTPAGMWETSTPPFHGDHVSQHQPADANHCTAPCPRGAGRSSAALEEQPALSPGACSSRHAHAGGGGGGPSGTKLGHNPPAHDKQQLQRWGRRG